MTMTAVAPRAHDQFDRVVGHARGRARQFTLLTTSVTPEATALLREREQQTSYDDIAADLLLIWQHHQQLDDLPLLRQLQSSLHGRSVTLLRRNYADNVTGVCRKLAWSPTVLLNSIDRRVRDKLMWSIPKLVHGATEPAAQHTRTMLRDAFVHAYSQEIAGVLRGSSSANSLYNAVMPLMTSGLEQKLKTKYGSRCVTAALEQTNIDAFAATLAAKSFAAGGDSEQARYNIIAAFELETKRLAETDLTET